MVIYNEKLLNLIYIKEECNPDNIEHLINFEKRRLVCKAIIEIMTYQQNCYNLQVINRI